MSYANSKVTVPFSISDVKAAVGYNSGDLATLIANGTINIWAKYKPVCKNLIDTVTGQWDATNNKWLASATWWKGNLADYIGCIKPKEFNVFSQLLSFYDGNLNGWEYDRPAGGASQPYRLWDFACYNKDAPKPIEGFFMADKIRQHGQFTASAMMSMPTADADYITLADFTSQAFDTLYWGIAFYSGTTFKCKLTASTPGVAQIESTFAGAAVTLQLGTYQVYPFFASDEIPITQTQEQSGMKYYTCPNCSPVTVEIVNDQTGTDAQITGDYITQTSLLISAMGDSGRAYDHCYAYVIPATYFDNPSAGISEAIWHQNDFTLGQSELKSWPRFTPPSGVYFVYMTINNSQYWVKNQILTPVQPPTQ
jgi:hypothetical protein